MSSKPPNASRCAGAGKHMSSGETAMNETRAAAGPIVVIEGARKSFAPSNGPKVLAIENLSFSVAEGEYVAIAGPTGAGKSVLFDCLTGLKTLDRGQITIGGQSAETYRRKRQGRITRIFQEDRLLPW